MNISRLIMLIYSQILISREKVSYKKYLIYSGLINSDVMFDQNEHLKRKTIRTCRNISNVANTKIIKLVNGRSRSCHDRNNIVLFSTCPVKRRINLSHKNYFYINDNIHFYIMRYHIFYFLLGSFFFISDKYSS